MRKIAALTILVFIGIASAHAEGEAENLFGTSKKLNMRHSAALRSAPQAAASEDVRAQLGDTLAKADQESKTTTKFGTNRKLGMRSSNAMRSAESGKTLGSDTDARARADINGLDDAKKLDAPINGNFGTSRRLQQRVNSR